MTTLARLLARLFDLSDRLLTPWVRNALSTWGLGAIFVMVTAERTLSAYRLGYIAIDLRIYRAAAVSWIQGGDPWRAGAENLTFAAPPPSLIPYIPAAAVPESVAILVYGAVSIAAAVVVLRAVQLPLWWLLFPPLAESLVVLNANVLVLALLLRGGRWAFASMLFKVYAAIPLIIQRRWLAVVLGGLVCALSLPLLPLFLVDSAMITEALDIQSSGGLSAWGSWLMLPTVLALAALGRRGGAAWLAVPALWPYTQLHYSLLALPVAARSPVTAYLLCFAVLYFPPIAVIVLALEAIARRVAEPYRSGAMRIEPSTSA